MNREQSDIARERARANALQSELDQARRELAQTKAALITEIGLHQKTRLRMAAQVDRRSEGARELTRAHWRHTRDRAACGAAVTAEINAAPSREFFFYTAPEARCPKCEESAMRIALPLFQAALATLGHGGGRHGE